MNEADIKNFNEALKKSEKYLNVLPFNVKSEEDRLAENFDQLNHLKNLTMESLM